MAQLKSITVRGDSCPLFDGTGQPANITTQQIIAVNTTATWYSTTFNVDGGGTWNMALQSDTLGVEFQIEYKANSMLG
jgi:hypothetical protein